MVDTTVVQRTVDALAANRVRRAEAEAELDAAKRELTELLVRGQDASVKVAPMARAAGISRETAHKLLRRQQGGDDA